MLPGTLNGQPAAGTLWDQIMDVENGKGKTEQEKSGKERHTNWNTTNQSRTFQNMRNNVEKEMKVLGTQTFSVNYAMLPAPRGARH